MRFAVRPCSGSFAPASMRRTRSAAAACAPSTHSAVRRARISSGVSPARRAGGGGLGGGGGARGGGLVDERGARLPLLEGGGPTDGERDQREREPSGDERARDGEEQHGRLSIGDRRGCVKMRFHWNFPGSC